MPDDIVMYWLPIDEGDNETPPVPAPIWNFIDEQEIPMHMLFVNEDGEILVHNEESKS